MAILGFLVLLLSQKQNVPRKVCDLNLNGFEQWENHRLGFMHTTNCKEKGVELWRITVRLNRMHRLS